MKKKGILLVVLLLAIGFAAVTTTLFINGSIGYQTNKEDFEVYYSKALVNGVIDNSVITDDTHIVFTEEMKSVGDTYVLDYDVTNGSRNYDAQLQMTCTESNEYLSVTNVFDTTINLPATETRSGKLTIELIKGYAGEEDKEVTIECTISANAVERETLSDGTPSDKIIFIPVTAVNSTGKDLNAKSYEIVGTTKDILLDKLLESGKVTSADDVDALIEVESDEFDSLATTIFDVSKIANDGDTVVILHFNELTQEWEYVAEETVVDGKVTSDFTSYSPVAFVVKKDDGTYEIINNDVNLYELIASNADRTTTIDFSVRSGVSETNGIYTTTQTEGNVPVYYYRGNVDNNIIFNNMCWKIIRTTEKRGVKLIYNGTPIDGQCTATGKDTQIGTRFFNLSGNDNAYVGYMFGNVYYSDNGKSSDNSSLSMPSSSKYYYGKSYTFDPTTGIYSLSGELTSGIWSEEYIGYYTCKSTYSNTKCSYLYYMSSYTDATHGNAYKTTSTIHNTTSYSEAHANINNSYIKAYIDDWYEVNIKGTNAENKLEDTVFCNDRSTVSGGNNNKLSSSSYGTLGYGKNVTGYGVLSRASFWTTSPNPSLVCPQVNDKFTVNASNGNGKLKYSVGLITLDEAVLAGFNTNKSNTNDYYDKNNYLYTGETFWTFSPDRWSDGSGQVGVITALGGIGTLTASNSNAGVRPVVSLADGTLVESNGDGSSPNPYVVK